MPNYELPLPLHAIGIKLQRADENCEHLNRIIADFVASQRANYRITKHLEAEGAHYSFKISGQITVPHIIPILIGEVIHHLRSCFDHLVWALVIQNGEKPHSRLQFPTAKTKEDFDKAVAQGYIRGVSRDAADFIGRMQPYLVPDPKNHLLSIIHDLDVVDKHRVILTAAAGGAMGETLTLTGSAGGVIDIELGPPTFVRLGDTEREFFYVNLSPNQSQFDADLDAIIQIGLVDITAQDFHSTNSLLASLNEFTKNVIVEAIPYFN